MGHLGTGEAGVVREHDDGTLFEAKSVEGALERVTVRELGDLVRPRWWIELSDGDIEA